MIRYHNQAIFSVRVHSATVQQLLHIPFRNIRVSQIMFIRLPLIMALRVLLRALTVFLQLRIYRQQEQLEFA